MSGVAKAGAAAPQGTTAPAAARSDLAEIRQEDLSHVTISTRTGPVEIYLYARDQKASIVASPYCGANKGDHQFEGHYQLISTRGESIVSRLAVLPGGAFFVAERPPHDGIHLFNANGHRLAVLYEYGGCNTEIFHAYRLDPQGKLAPVDFLDRDGRRFSGRATNPEGKVKSLPDGRDVFCWYNNGIGRSLSDVYRYDGRNFVQVDTWMSWEGGSDNIEGVIPVQRAARALYDFLVALGSQMYQVAAFYFGGAVGSASKSRLQVAANLKDYCKSSEARCWTPFGISAGKTAGAAAAMAFEVLLVDMSSADNQEFHGTFRVQRKGTRFVVLSLPQGAPRKK